MNLLDIPLPQLSRAEVGMRNTLIANFANHVYEFQDTRFFLKASETAPKQAVQIKLCYLGQVGYLYADLALVNTFLSPYALQLENMSADAIRLFLLKLSIDLPRNLQIMDMQLCDASACTDYFSLVSYDNGQPTNWTIGFGFSKDFPLKHLTAMLKPYLKGVMAHQWQQLPISIPLVVSSLSIPAHEIPALEVGDVLFLEG